MPTIIPTAPPLTGPAVLIPNVDMFDWGAVGYQPTGTPAAPLSDGMPVAYHLPTLPTIGRAPGHVAVQTGNERFDVRTVDPAYGYWNVRAPFEGQGYYDHVPNGTSAPVTGNGTPNTHATALRAGVLTQLAQYTPDPYTYSAAYVGSLTPQTIAVGYGGIQS